jgi:quercetin dioxygenase-like cupin family protein
MESMSPADGTTVEAVDGAYLTQLVSGDRTSVQHFHLKSGTTVPEHSHEHEQTGYVVDGTLTFLIDGEEHIIHPGESFVVPPNIPHAVENRSEMPANGIDVFSPPRPDPEWLDTHDSSESA